MATVALKTITNVERDEELSQHGIPCWTVTFHDGTVRRTAVDAPVSFGIGNAVFRDPMTSPVSVTFDSKGDVIGIRQGEGIQCGHCV